MSLATDADGGMTTTMETAAGFDPYRAWLGVRDVRRPLNAYQLLGLPTFEEDAEVIHAAAGVRRAALLTHREQATPEIWGQVYCELDEAIDLLLDPDKKAAYDLALQAAAEAQGAGLTAVGSVTEKGRGAALRCTRCRAANPATRKFCAQCGEHLWEPCVQCGTLCAASERFCGACGTNLAAGIRGEQRRLQDDLDRAAELQAENHFDEALELLGSVARTEHPRHADLVARANQQIKQLAAQRDRKQIVAAEKHQEAQRLFDAYAYDAAEAVLAETPAPLLTPPMLELRQQCRQRLEEIGGLERELHAAVAARRFEGLLSKIERLLQLKPDHAAGKSIAGELQNHLCRAARQRLAQHRYEEAFALLDQVPESVRTEATAKYHAHAAEIAWMVWDVRHAPLVDNCLLKTADRLQPAVRDDAALSAGLTKLRQRGEKLAAARTPVTWAAPPAETPFGVPVEWLTTLKRVPAGEAAEAALKEHPGEYFAAVGAALQALGRGPLRLNLVPHDQRTMLGRVTAGVTQMMRLRAARSAWGIDVGSSGLKAVKLVWDEQHKQPQIESARFVPYRKTLGQAVNAAEEERLVDEAVKRLVGEGELRADRIALAFLSRWLLLRQFKLPPVDDARLPRLVEFEAQLQVPAPLAELVWDFQLAEDLRPAVAVAGRSGTEKGAPSETPPRREHNVVVAAVKHDQIHRLLSHFHAAHLYADVVQADALALYNALFFELFAAETAADDKPPVPVALLDIGADAVNLICCAPQLLWHRRFHQGGQNVSRALVQAMQLTFAQAEELKRDPAAARPYSRFCRTVGPVFQDLLQEVRNGLESFDRAHPGRTPARLAAFGGGMQMHGLFRCLRSGR